MRLLTEAAREQVIDMFGDVVSSAVAGPDELGQLAFLLLRRCVGTDERAKQFKGAHRFVLGSA